MNHQKYYECNVAYSKFLESHKQSSYNKYVTKIVEFAKKNNKILDVGCGTGTALELLAKNAHLKLFGIEISKSSLNKCKSKTIAYKWYDGENISYDDSNFNIVGSFNVLEHTDNPIQFLNESWRVLMPNGYLFIVCPNFLATTNNYHKNTKGILRKIINTSSICYKLLSPIVSFRKMEPTKSAVILPDHDAVNETNPIDIIHWARDKRLQLVYWSSQQQYMPGIGSLLDFGTFRYFFGSCFFIFKKK